MSQTKTQLVEGLDLASAPADSLVIDSSGRVLVGTSSARSNFYNTTAGAVLQVEGLGGRGDSRRIAVMGSDNTAESGGGLLLAHQRSGSIGGNTILQSGDDIGVVTFQGNDGTDFVEAAVIEAEVDGTPGANDMPGRLVFSTTADGASSPTERMRISANGNLTVDTDTLVVDAVNDRVGVNRTPDSQLDIQGANCNFRITSNDGNTSCNLQTIESAEVRFGPTTSSALAFYSNTERARIDSSGRLLVGTASWTGDGLFVVEGRVASGASNAVIQLARGDGNIPSNNGVGAVEFTNNAAGSGASIYAVADANWTSGTSHPTRLEFYTCASGASSLTRRMWVNSAGQLRFDSSGAGGIIFENSGNRIFFGGPTNASVGTSSAGSGSTTLYIGNAAIQVSSDVRLKENIKDTELDALDAISQIKVKDFTWNDPTDTSHNNRNARGKWTGLIAQELVEVLPFVVNAPRKEENGSIDYESEDRWLLDQSQLCPVLIKAVQQQQEIIASLEARLSALEAS